METQTNTNAPIGLTLRDTGSLTNWILASGLSGVPVVGEGATEFMHTDRHAFTVVEVSKDGKTCYIVEDIATRTDSNGMSDSQQYSYAPNPNGHRIKLVFKWGAWRRETERTVFTDELNTWIDANREEWNDTYSYKGTRLLSENHVDWILTKGLIETKKVYNKIHIKFGVRDKHYDYSF